MQHAHEAPQVPADTPAWRTMPTSRLPITTQGWAAAWGRGAVGTGTGVRDLQGKDGDMADRTNATDEGNAIKDPDDWTTGDQPATGAQESYLRTLATEAHEEAPEGLTKADASRKIDELQEKTGRGS
jgi:hypothetical protein